MLEGHCLALTEEVEHLNESFEIQSPERKVIRVESEETQDYVRLTLAISQEESRGDGLRTARPQ